MLEVYEFRGSRWLAVLDRGALAALAGCPSRVESLGRVFRVEGCSGGRVVLVSGEGFRFVFSLGMALRLARRGRDLVVVGSRGVAGRAELWGGGHYYKLVVTGEAPTLEIDGIHMHRVEGVTPLRDAALKAGSVVRRGSRVLDLCTGLGYTAIASLRRGARLVVTVEASSEVLQLAALNPYSWPLESERVIVLRARAEEAVSLLPPGFFDAVIHDPPRFTGETSSLYSMELYREIYRVLRRGGRLYHYTGEPGKRRGLNLPGRTARLLREAGFRVLGYRRSLLGVLAVKE